MIFLKSLVFFFTFYSIFLLLNNDIVAVNTEKSQVIILDPTVRFEKSALQALEVNNEKKSIYEPCIPDLARRYNVEESKFQTVVGSQATSSLHGCTAEQVSLLNTVILY